MPRPAYILGVFAMTLLVACGGQPGSSNTPAGAQATSAPTIVASPTARPTRPPAATLATSAPATALPAPTEALQAVAPAGPAAIARGRTPEGYHVLGNPEAPVAMQFYSDFL
jgi:hypothetical protein